MSEPPKDFGPGFAWGAATSPLQIEGAAGRGRSIWDAFCDVPGKVFGGHNTLRACEHLQRADGDVQLFGECGWNAYRFGISWSRVCPEAPYPPDPRKLDSYDRLVDALLEAGIEPWVTVFHWDMPLALQWRGGWLNRDSAEWLGEFAAALGARFAGRVRHWFTLNEPQCFIGLGYYRGLHAPGLTLDLASALAAGHHALLAHGRAVSALRAAWGENKIGWSSCGVLAVPATNSAEDREAARHASFDMSLDNPLVRGEPNPVWSNTWWSDPVFFGAYPEDALRRFGAAAPEPANGDMECISQPMDFNGLTVYTAPVVKSAPQGLEVVPLPPGWPASSLGWPVIPDSLYWGSKFLYERYRCPIVIAENGIALRDWPDADGRVADPARVDYTSRHLAALARWKREGGEVLGYFHWSAMDNFEWAEGYKDRFGLIHVDFETQRRTLKDSARWYAEVIRENGARFFSTDARTGLTAPSLSPPQFGPPKAFAVPCP